MIAKTSLAKLLHLLTVAGGIAEQIFAEDEEMRLNRGGSVGGGQSPNIIERPVGEVVAPVIGTIPDATIRTNTPQGTEVFRVTVNHADSVSITGPFSVTLSGNQAIATLDGDVSTVGNLTPELTATNPVASPTKQASVEVKQGAGQPVVTVNTIEIPETSPNGTRFGPVVVATNPNQDAGADPHTFSLTDLPAGMSFDAAANEIVIDNVNLLDPAETTVTAEADNEIGFPSSVGSNTGLVCVKAIPGMSLINELNHNGGTSINTSYAGLSTDDVIVYELEGNTGAVTGVLDTGPDAPPDDHELLRLVKNSDTNWSLQWKDKSEVSGLPVDLQELPDFNYPVDSQTAPYIRDGGYWVQPKFVDSVGGVVTFKQKITVTNNITQPGSSEMVVGKHAMYSPESSRCVGWGRHHFFDLINQKVDGAQRVGMRFRTPKAGTLKQARIYWIANPPNYSSGTGGTIVVEVWPVDSSGKYPNLSGSPIASDTLVAGLSNGNFASGDISEIYSPIVFNGGNLAADTRYIMTFRNTDPNASTNWICTDDFLDRHGIGSPHIDLLDFGIVLGNSTGSSWTDRSVDDTYDIRRPNLQIEYTDGTVFGELRMESARLEDRIPDATEALPVRDYYQNTGITGNPLVGCEINCCFKTPGELDVDILDADGSTVLHSETIVQATANYSTPLINPSSGKYRVKPVNYRLPFASPVSVGENFFIRMTPRNGAVVIVDSGRDLGHYSQYVQSCPNGAQRYDGNQWEWFDQWDSTNYDDTQRENSWNTCVHYQNPNPGIPFIGSLASLLAWVAVAFTLQSFEAQAVPAYLTPTIDTRFDAGSSEWP